MKDERTKARKRIRNKKKRKTAADAQTGITKDKPGK